MRFEIVGRIEAVTTIASGTGVKGVATIRLANGQVRRVELHWYEAHGIGRRDFKIKRYDDES